ncbi:MAG: HAMP domain-containing histidine kinase [Candidatus Staskawiczbacteria bacterium]|nr:HAMP domain-containing histidine kinase [Candidatus Staskawiczbacteria bacterium]
MKKVPAQKSKTEARIEPKTITGAMLLSHQLMSTLTAMKWSLKMLNQGDFGQMSKEQKNITEKIDQRNDILITLANRVLHTSKLEDEKYCCNPGVVNMEEAVNTIMGYCKESAAKKSIAIEYTKLTEKIPAILADEEMVKIAIQNIFDNAIKYSLEGGSIKVSLGFNDKNVELKIQDSGIGVPDSQKEHLFHKFFRAGNAIKLSAAGSGLGLFISKNIIEAHNGKIWFDSEENKGSTFYLSLPIKMVE